MPTNRTDFEGKVTCTCYNHCVVFQLENIAVEDTFGTTTTGSNDNLLISRGCTNKQSNIIYFKQNISCSSVIYCFVMLSNVQCIIKCIVLNISYHNYIFLIHYIVIYFLWIFDFYMIQYTNALWKYINDNIYGLE